MSTSRTLLRHARTLLPLLTLVGACGGGSDVSLNPPAAGQGFQLTSPVFEVPSGQEIQGCYFLKVPDLNNGQPYYITNIEVAQNPGTHHMNIFRTPYGANPVGTPNTLKGAAADGTGSVVSMNGTGDCFVSSNWADWPLVVNSQTGTVSNQANGNYLLQFPTTPKVGQKMTPGEILMLQTHYVNASTQKTPGRGKVLVNFNRLMDTTDVHELYTLFANNQSIAICKDNPTPKYTATHKLSDPTKPAVIFAANGHFHSRGTDFTMCAWDGTSTIDDCASTKYYESTAWDEPPMTTGLNVAIPAGGGIAWTCSFQWKPSPACADGCSCIKEPKGKTATDCCYGFGGVVEISEHCNTFTYYYYP